MGHRGLLCKALCRFWRPPARRPGPQRWFDRTSRAGPTGRRPVQPRGQRRAARMQPFHPSATIARIVRVGRWHAALRPAGRRARGVEQVLVQGLQPLPLRLPVGQRGLGLLIATQLLAQRRACAGVRAVQKGVPGAGSFSARWVGTGCLGSMAGIGARAIEATQHRRGTACGRHGARLGGGCRG